MSEYSSAARERHCMVGANALNKKDKCSYSSQVTLHDSLVCTACTCYVL